jgi:hypothetical protein
MPECFESRMDWKRFHGNRSLNAMPLQVVVHPATGFSWHFKPFLGKTPSVSDWLQTCSLGCLIVTLSQTV